MVVVARFVQCAQVSQAQWSPELARSFKSTLALATSRFHRSTADRPAAVRNLFVVHSPRLSGKIVFLLSHCFTSLAAWRFKLRDLLQHALLLSMAQPMQSRLYPYLSFGFICSVTSSPQFPQVLTAMIKIQKLSGLRPTVGFQIPNPRTPISQHQRF